MARSRLPGWLLLLAVAGCARGPLPPRLPPTAPPPLTTEAGTQTLYRVTYDGPAGDGRLRLVLRQAAPDRFQIQTSDVLGRAVWSLELAGGEVLLVDHRQSRACRASGELRVPEIALQPLPLTSIPRVLDGRAPLPPPAGVADESDWTDAAGRRWTQRQEGGELRSWMLWEEGEPLLWWTWQPRGGILSHREGSQFRWRQAAREELHAAGYAALEVPAGYRLEPCSGPAEQGAAYILPAFRSAAAGQPLQHRGGSP